VTDTGGAGVMLPSSLLEPLLIEMGRSKYEDLGSFCKGGRGESQERRVSFLLCYKK